MIEQEYEEAFPGRVEVHPRYGGNPSIADSVRDVNGMLLNAEGEVRLLIHPRCEYTIRDFEQVTFKPGKPELDKTDKALTQHSDAVRYCISDEWPAVPMEAGAVQPAGW